MTPETEKKVGEAITYTLKRIRDDSSIGWYMGHGTQAFELLTAAHSAMSGLDQETVKEAFAPINPVDPEAQ
jgi:hypothetical protein